MASIKRFVIHELFKDKNPDVASEILNLENDVILKLAKDLVKIKDNRTAVLWGQFKGNGDFPLKLKELDIDQTDEERNKTFLELTEKTMNSLYEEIVHTNSKGGYICFIEYKSFHDHRLMAAMITNTSGIKLTNLKPTSEVHVDLSKLHQAVDINMTGYFKSLNDEYSKNYLSFIGKGKHTDYFTSAFDCINKITPAKAVNKAPVVLKDFLSQFNVDNITQKNARAQLVKYLTDNIGKEVHLSKIEEIAVSHLPDSCTEEEKQSFIAFSKQDKYEMPATFEARKNNVDKLAKIYYSTESFSLNFDLEIIGLVGVEADSNKPILFNKDNDDIIIKGRMITPEVRAAIAQVTLIDEDGNE
ncbi:nucleoid-associated protein [Vibrio sp. Vb2880]|nr:MULTISPECIES: nucleoid-associated protein [Vibrio]EKO3581131.1 nucleoid-associated protein [Vibrio metschnikovii]ATI46113.1 nucleoid-associated protein [Vibrio parahaemolyticus]EGQ9883709.1 nucleoid-associated protein [Vibrio vulnificus]EGR0666844.1 nucleoid-associated protein [Vibrio cholerae]EGR08491.1 nucleoid-associated -like protein [Vibrio cholerae HE48]